MSADRHFIRLNKVFITINFIIIIIIIIIITTTTTTTTIISEYLIEVGVGLRFSDAIEILHINKLEVKVETGVLHSVLWPRDHVWEVTKLLVPPVIQTTQTEIQRVEHYLS